MIIYLIGYMGCGKSRVGKKLARELDYKFIDLDDYIEEKTRRSIPKIFEIEGESGFRGIEKKYLKEVSELEDIVISTGGGTPCFYDNLAKMNETGLSIYLFMDVASLTYRLLNSTKERPLIKGLGLEKLHDYVKQNLEERAEYYENAGMVINGLGLDAKKVRLLATEIKLIK